MSHALKRLWTEERTGSGRIWVNSGLVAVCNCCFRCIGGGASNLLMCKGKSSQALAFPELGLAYFCFHIDFVLANFPVVDR